MRVKDLIKILKRADPKAKVYAEIDFDDKTITQSFAILTLEGKLFISIDSPTKKKYEKR